MSANEDIADTELVTCLTIYQSFVFVFVHKRISGSNRLKREHAKKLEDVDLGELDVVHCRIDSGAVGTGHIGARSCWASSWLPRMIS